MKKWCLTINLKDWTTQTEGMPAEEAVVYMTTMNRTWQHQSSELQQWLTDNLTADNQLTRCQICGDWLPSWVTGVCCMCNTTVCRDCVNELAVCGNCQGG